MAYASLEDAALNGWEVERAYMCQTHGDHDASASLNGVTGAYVCYACGDKGKLDFDKLEIEISTDGIRSLIDDLEKTINPVHHRYPERYLDRYDCDGMGDYWSSRYSKTTGAHYRLGHAPGVATYPLRDNTGDVIGVVKRDLVGDKGWRYKYPDGSKVSNYLFDIHRVQTDDIILCEGATDAMAVYDTGLEIGATACYGARLSAAQAKLIKKYDPKTLWVGFDMDRAGKDGFDQIKEVLGDDVHIRRLIWRDYKDLSEMPLDKRTSYLSNVLDISQRPVDRIKLKHIVLRTCSNESSKNPQLVGI